MNNAFEKYLQDTTYWTQDGYPYTHITHQEALVRLGYDIDTIRHRVRDDFLIYRYYMQDSILVKDCFYMQFDCVSGNGHIRYESRLSESNKATMKLCECDFPKLIGPITKLHKYVYRFEEDDELVIQFFINLEQEKKQKLLQELNDIDKSLNYLNNLRR